MKRDENIERFLNYWICNADAYADDCASSRISFLKFIGYLEVMLRMLRLYKDYIDDFHSDDLALRIEEYGATWENGEYKINRTIAKLKCLQQRKAEQEMANHIDFCIYDMSKEKK